MYADNIIIMSPSLAGLQHMLDKCTQYGNAFNIVFNAVKTVCIATSKKLLIPTNTYVFIDGNAIPWVRSFKYLGVVFNISTRCVRWRQL